MWVIKIPRIKANKKLFNILKYTYELYEDKTVPYIMWDPKFESRTHH